MIPQMYLYQVMIISSLTIFILRYFPVMFLQTVEIPSIVKKIFRNLPLGLLSALVCQSSFYQGKQFNIGWDNFYLIGLIISVLVAIKTRSLILVISSGVVAVAIGTFLKTIMQ